MNPTLINTIRLQPIQEDILSNAEWAFIIQAAKSKQIRLDGRSLHEARPCQLDIKTINNNKSLVTCTLGNSTKVSCSVTCELVVPYPDRPHEGILNIQTDFMHSAKPGAPQTGSIVDLQIIERTIQKAIDVESLCIVPGTKVWHVKCQLVIIDDCGSVTDCCSIAACGALLHFRRPDITVVGEDVTVHSVEDRIPVPLSIHYIPISVSFALIDTQGVDTQPMEAGHSNQDDPMMDDKNWIALVDPTDREESVAKQGSFQVVLNAHKEICGLNECGPLLSREGFKTLIETAILVRRDRGLALDEALRLSPFLAIG